MAALSPATAKAARRRSLAPTRACSNAAQSSNSRCTAAASTLASKLRAVASSADRDEEEVVTSRDGGGIARGCDAEHFGVSPMRFPHRGRRPCAEQRRDVRCPWSGRTVVGTRRARASRASSHVILSYINNRQPRVADRVTPGAERSGRSHTPVTGFINEAQTSNRGLRRTKFAVSLRPPRCVSTGPVVVRLAGMANEREREREVCRDEARTLALGPRRGLFDTVHTASASRVARAAGCVSTTRSACT